VDDDNGGSGVGNDDDTLHVLERAKALFWGTSSQSSSKKQPSGQRLQATENKRSFLVQRVSDLTSEFDSSTFDKMFDNSYLPRQLLPATCGGTRRNVQDDEEVLETSTLDYLANLYVEEDLQAGRSHDTDKKVSSTVQVPQQQPTQRRPGPSETPHAKPSKPSRQVASPGPFHLVPPSSHLYEDLLRDPAYQHALQAGTLWQSLCSQHVRFPAHWWDGLEGGPPLGTPEKFPWRYLSRHRVKNDQKLNALIGNRGSSGRLLMHLVVRDKTTGEPLEDICCGVYHPNARGVRTTPEFDPRIEDCRDIWIAHRRRYNVPKQRGGAGGASMSMIESWLFKQNKNRVFASPLGAGIEGQSSTYDVHNRNLKAVFGEKPPLFTVFVNESELLELFKDGKAARSPASVILLRRYLRRRVG
jgi:hypothetical protein